MFTGIVTELGIVQAVADDDGMRAFTIRAPATVVGLRVGDSVAVNGVCLTAIVVADDSFTVEAMEETLVRSSLGSILDGESINLERPMPAAGRFDGHIVQGHVDGVALVDAITDEGAAKRFQFSISRSLGRYLVDKGSVTVDGVSLTVTCVSPADADRQVFEVAIIPHTLDSTVFGAYVVGTAVNIEVDVLAKYVERLMEVR